MTYTFIKCVALAVAIGVVASRLPKGSMWRIAPATAVGVATAWTFGEPSIRVVLLAIVSGFVTSTVATIIFQRSDSGRPRARKRQPALGPGPALRALSWLGRSPRNADEWFRERELEWRSAVPPADHKRSPWHHQHTHESPSHHRTTGESQPWPEP